MAQYIDKDALVAEIERLVTIYNDDDNIHHVAKYNILVDILSFLNTLEVKEVNFIKELDKEWNKCEPVDEGMGLEIASIEHEQFDNIAKHFFELGMAVSNPLTVKDIKKIYHLVNEVSDDLGFMAMYVNIYQEALKRFKAQKG